VYPKRIPRLWKRGEKGGSDAALTLRQCLEQVAHLDTDYVVREQERAWSAVALLAWLTHQHPDQVNQHVYLRLPDEHQEGAITKRSPRGGFLPLYRICLGS
jgi:hypothetical protein